MKMKNIYKPILLIVLAILLTTCGLQQNLSVSYRLSPGMTKSEVEAIMGPPAKSDFYKNIEEWHYCKTGMDSDEFLALFFYEGKLVEKLNYTVTIAIQEAQQVHARSLLKWGITENQIELLK